MFRLITILIIFFIATAVFPGCGAISTPVELRLLVSSNLSGRLGPCG